MSWNDRLTLEEARAPACLLFECVAGSRAYGTDLPGSDIDLRGVFVQPRDRFFGLGRIDQISDENNDETYYEIGRFIELLAKNNPNILEVLFASERDTRFRHSSFDLIRPEMVLSKLCEQTFAGYAITQIRKARGLNKKIVNPMEGPRKTLIDFCYIIEGQGSIPLGKWLEENKLEQGACGLVSVPHMRAVYGLYIGENYRGVFSGEEANDVLMSSVAKEAEAVAWMSFNKDGYKKYCREYAEYQTWVKNRNASRYQANVDQGRNYDAKNLMHTFRLIDVAAEIAREGSFTVHRPNREFLLSIRAGEFDYDDLISMAEERLAEIGPLYAASDLPDEPDQEALEEALIAIREQFYTSDV